MLNDDQPRLAQLVVAALILAALPLPGGDPQVPNAANTPNAAATVPHAASHSGTVPKALKDHQSANATTYW